MTSKERRLQELERRFMPAPETAFNRELLSRIEAGRRRAQLDRQAQGSSEPSDEGLPLGDHASRGLQHTIEVLHERRERNHLRWLSEKVLHVSGTLATGDDLWR